VDASWLVNGLERIGVLLASADQGTVLGRAGRVHVTAEDDDVWVGGGPTTCIQGTVLL
jgi:predicted PhzF superfamily epimerase YddE/YHI9